MTEAAVFQQELLNELKEIKRELSFIRKHMIDIDTFLTPEEAKRLDESIKEHKAGKTVNFEEN